MSPPWRGAELPAPAFIPRTSLQLQAFNTGNKSNICAAVASVTLLIVPLCCSMVTAGTLYNRMVQTLRILSDTHTGAGWQLVHFSAVLFDPVVILQGKENYSLNPCIITPGLEKNGSYCHFLAETKMPLYIPVKN